MHILKNNFFRLYTLWITCSDWIITHTQWLTSPFIVLNADQISKFIMECSRVAVRSIKIYKNKKEGPAYVAQQLKSKVNNLAMLTFFRLMNSKS